MMGACVALLASCSSTSETTALHVHLDGSADVVTETSDEPDAAAGDEPAELLDAAGELQQDAPSEADPIGEAEAAAIDVVTEAADEPTDAAPARCCWANGIDECDCYDRVAGGWPPTCEDPMRPNPVAFCSYLACCWMHAAHPEEGCACYSADMISHTLEGTCGAWVQTHDAVQIASCDQI